MLARHLVKVIENSYETGTRLPIKVEYKQMAADLALSSQTMDRLPLEIVEMICKCVRYQDLFNVRLVCRRFDVIASGNIIFILRHDSVRLGNFEQLLLLPPQSRMWAVYEHVQYEYGQRIRSGGENLIRLS